MRGGGHLQTKITNTVAAHIMAVYHAMKEEADEDGIYTGSRAELVRSLGISSTFYAAIFRALEEGGFCVLFERGGRNKPSKVALLHEPSPDLLQDLTIDANEPILSLVNRLEVIERSLGGINVIGAMETIANRLSAIESRLEESNGKTQEKPRSKRSRSTKSR